MKSRYGNREHLGRILLTRPEFAALPPGMGVQYADGSCLLTYYTRGRWPRFTFCQVEFIEEATT